MQTDTGKFRRWTAAWILAVLVHAALVGILAWKLMPDDLVSISGMVPMPGETIELMPAQALEAAVFFASKPEIVNPQAAKLYKLEANGMRTLVSESHLHPKRQFGLQFGAVSEPGIYEIEILDGLDGSDGVILEPRVLDGEFKGIFPTGDGKAGGVFRARFGVAHKKHEVMTASMYDPQKPLANEEPAAASMPDKPQKMPQKVTPKPVKEPPKTQPKSKEPPKPKEQPKETPKLPVQEAASPLPPAEAVTEAPSHVAVSPEHLRLSPLNFAPSLLEASAQTAAQTFAERDMNKFVAAAAESKRRYEAAYAQGPVIGPGQQGNSLSHQKDVAEYLALMHKEIHPLWAHGYLLRLDTIYRQPGSRLNSSDLEAVLEITLDSLGNVSDVRMVRSSGITDYDNEAIHVAWNASPKMPPPAEMRSPNGKSYIHWTFWRDGRQCGVFGVKVFKYKGTQRDALNFSLKAVQLQEKKLGLKPSVVSIPGIENLKTVPEPSSSLPLPEKINPLED